jgi:4-carboxymuconolactone decarboxylase
VTSESRLHRLVPAELTEEQRQMYDAVVGGPRRGTSGLVDSEGRLGGPLNTLLYAPVLGTAQQGVGAALRFQISLSRRVVELVILAVAHDAQSEFELAAHEPMAHGVGLTHEQLAALSDRREPVLDDPVERIAWRTTIQLLATGELDDVAYEQAVGGLGERGLVELTTLVGYYRLLALQLRVFGITREAYAGPAYTPPVTADTREGSRE